MDLKWRPKPGKARSVKKLPAITPQSDGRFPQRRTAAVEIDPIEMYDDDSYMSSEEKDVTSEEPPRSTEHIPLHRLELEDHTSKLADKRPENRLARQNSDPASDLYRKMCLLRREVSGI